MSASDSDNDDFFDAVGMDDEVVFVSNQGIPPPPLPLPDDPTHASPGPVAATAVSSVPVAPLSHSRSGHSPASSTGKSSSAVLDSQTIPGGNVSFSHSAVVSPASTHSRPGSVSGSVTAPTPFVMALGRSPVTPSGTAPGRARSTPGSASTPAGSTVQPRSRPPTIPPIQTRSSSSVDSSSGLAPSSAHVTPSDDASSGSAFSSPFPPPVHAPTSPSPLVVSPSPDLADFRRRPDLDLPFLRSNGEPGGPGSRTTPTTDAATPFTRLSLGNSGEYADAHAGALDVVVTPLAGAAAAAGTPVTSASLAGRDSAKAAAAAAATSMPDVLDLPLSPDSPAVTGQGAGGAAPSGTAAAAAATAGGPVTIVDRDTGATYTLDDLDKEDVFLQTHTFTPDDFVGCSAVAGTSPGGDSGHGVGRGGGAGPLGPTAPAAGAGHARVASCPDFGGTAKPSKVGSSAPAGSSRGLFSRLRRRHDKGHADGFVKVSTHHKDKKELSRLVLCQQLDAHERNGEAVWVMKFSMDGQYLASAGGHPSAEDADSMGVVRVWQVDHDAVKTPSTSPSSSSSSSAAAAASAAATAAAVAAAPSTSASSLPPAFGSPVFKPKPLRQFVGHETHVVDLAWSRTNLLLSASMDRFVRLWHVSRDGCLHKFQHPQCVTSVAFHPSDDNYFLTGCFDKKLRVWSLETGRVVLWQATTVMITAVAFSPDARLVVAGLYNGICTFYLTDGLRYHTQVECRNRKGKMKHGRKVTGVEFINGGTELLVSTNDSRCRLINMDDYSMAFKFKGLTNKDMQIRASFDASGDRVICGSEDKHVYVWRTRNDCYKPHFRLGSANRQKNASYESFVGTHSREDGVATTVALFAPQPTLSTIRPPNPMSGALMQANDHMIIVTGDSKGSILVFENLPSS